MRKMSRCSQLGFAASVLVLAMCAGWAADGEALDERVTAKADRLEIDQQTGVQTLTGNVVITQGDITIYGNTIQVAMLNGAISRIYGSGEPIRFLQKLASGEVVQTESNEIDYLTTTWTLVLTGNVVLQRGDWQLDGQVVEYNIRNRNFHANGGDREKSTVSTDGSRVSITYNQ